MEELRTAMKQIIKEYGYRRINETLFESIMDDKRELKEDDFLQDCYFELFANNYYSLMMKLIEFDDQTQFI